MDILAINKAHDDSNKRYSRECLRYAILCLLATLGVVCFVIVDFCLYFPFSVLMLLLAFIVVWKGLTFWDDYLRWTRAVETVSVQKEILVIECRGGIIRRRKEIPLSTIRKVELFDGSHWWHSIGPTAVVIPERLIVVYSDSHRYRFGICLTEQERNELARKIMYWAQQYI